MTPPQNYVSDTLSHFVGRSLATEEERYQLLLKILDSGWLMHPPFNRNISGNLVMRRGAKLSENQAYNPEIVCFCDIPTTELTIHCKKYSPFGIGFARSFVAANGGSPVYYVANNSVVRVVAEHKTNEERDAARERAKTIGANAMWALQERGEFFDDLLEQYNLFMDHCMKLVVKDWSNHQKIELRPQQFAALRAKLDFHVFGMIKTFDCLHTDDHADNFYMEREWRVVGNVQFDSGDVTCVYAPVSFAARLAADRPDYASRTVALRV